MEPQDTPRGRPLPAQFRLSLSVASGNAREFELWRSALSPLYAMDAPDARARASFGVELTSYQFDDVAISSGHSSAAKLERSGQTIARSGLDNIGVQIYLDGGCDLDVEGRGTELRTGDVCILDMTRRHALRAPDYRSLSLVLPRAAIAPHLADVDGLHGLIMRRSTALNEMLVSHLRALFVTAPALGLSDMRAAARGTAALIAAFAGPSANGRDAIAQAAAAASLQLARHTIEANLHNPDLGPDFVSRQLGMSRAKLYRLFQPVGSVSQYIQQRRMTRAYQRITDPAHLRERVGTIAARYGFSNAAVFSRAFRQAYGVSPSELRSASQRGESTDIRLSGDSGFQTMSRWLLGIGAV